MNMVYHDTVIPVPNLIKNLSLSLEEGIILQGVN